MNNEVKTGAKVCIGIGVTLLVISLVLFFAVNEILGIVLMFTSLFAVTVGFIIYFCVDAIQKYKAKKTKNQGLNISESNSSTHSTVFEDIKNEFQTTKTSIINEFNSVEDENFDVKQTVSVNNKIIDNNDFALSDDIKDILKSAKDSITKAFGQITKTEEPKKDPITCEYCGSVNEWNKVKCSSCGGNLSRKK